MVENIRNHNNTSHVSNCIIQKGHDKLDSHLPQPYNRYSVSSVRHIYTNMYRLLNLKKTRYY